METRMNETRVAFNELLGRRVRLGSWEDQKISTYRKIKEAIEEQRWDDAATLGSYFVDEANVCFTLYRQWIADLNAFLRDRGVDVEKIEARNRQATELNRLPDGSAWHPRRHWDRFLSEVQAFTAATYREQRDEALRLLDEMKETWRQCHDRDVDHTYALMSLVKEELGEPAIRDMYDRVLLPLFVWRYEKFDIDKHPWDEALEVLMLVACEAMRGHLVGPERTGDFELIETEDRYILRFDPCGSGQRTVRGDWIERTPARMEPPYNWKVTEERHSWNHYTPGVCLYCAHCIILMEEMPIDRFGYPVRVIDPPVYPDTNPDPAVRQKCQWQMFKDPTAVPAEYYERVGRKKPDAFGSKAHGAGPLPNVTAGLPGAG
jgi:Fe-S-cluster formation regulator IscX/YfhJ